MSHDLTRRTTTGKISGSATVPSPARNATLRCNHEISAAGVLQDYRAIANRAARVLLVTGPAASLPRSQIPDQ